MTVENSNLACSRVTQSLHGTMHRPRAAIRVCSITPECLGAPKALQAEKSLTPPQGHARTTGLHDGTYRRDCAKSAALGLHAFATFLDGAESPRCVIPGLPGGGRSLSS